MQEDRLKICLCRLILLSLLEQIVEPILKKKEKHMVNQNRLVVVVVTTTTFTLFQPMKIEILLNRL